jgi:hypothetical protein
VGDVAVISKLDRYDLVTSGWECFPKCLHGCRARSVWVPGRIDNFRWWWCVALMVDSSGDGGSGAVMRAEMAVQHGDGE